jgi:lipopolysaccharide export system protein LptA
MSLPRRKGRWFSIELLRTVVIAGGVILVAAIVLLLAAGQWKRRFLAKDLPRRLGAHIEQQADGFDYTQSSKGKTLFKLHAGKLEKQKDGKTLLHSVVIELYGDDGKRTDTISGSEFEFDQTAGIAQAKGQAEITLMRPGVKPGVAQLRPGKKAPAAQKTGAEMGARGALAPKSLPNHDGEITDSDIHVKTSGLRFDQKSEIATTSERVDFALKQGNGSSIGAVYDSAKGQLILDHAVELHIHRGADPVTVHAGHGEFERGQLLCHLTQATAETSKGTLQMADALLHFRSDGSVEHVDGAGGVDMKTLAGSHLTAPRGALDFDAASHPRHGVLEGGAHLETAEPGRQSLGDAPRAVLDFNGEGELRKAHLETGVTFSSRQQATSAKGAPVELRRSWKSQMADIFFDNAPAGTQAAGSKTRPGSPEPRRIEGQGGVVVTSETVGAGSTQGPEKLAADSVVAVFAPNSVLSTLDGKGHASFEQFTAAGARQTSSSDELAVKFVPGPAGGAAGVTARAKGPAAGPAGGAQIASVVQTGQVVLTQEGAKATAGRAAQSPLFATAARLDYDGASQLLHLTGTPGSPPRVKNGGLDLTATRIDFHRQSGDGSAHGDVKASWMSAGQGNGQGNGSGNGQGNGLGNGPGNGAGNGSGGASSASSSGQGLLGGSGSAPAHAVSAEAEFQQGSQEVTFRSPTGAPARLWQAGNSVTAPLLILNRARQTLVARADGEANPVRTVLLGNSPSSGKDEAGKSAARGSGSGQTVMRVRSGELHYSEGERLAIFERGALSGVTVETSQPGGVSTVVSDRAEVKLLPAAAASHGSPASGAMGNGGVSPVTNSGPNSKIERMTANGHVDVAWPGRKAFGEKLVYLGDDGTFTLTGTSSSPPRMTDQQRGNVTGSALIFHSRDDSVTVEGDGGKTVTETQTPK